jgi:hypothetical protein
MILFFASVIAFDFTLLIFDCSQNLILLGLCLRSFNKAS